MFWWVKVLVAQSCPTLCDLMDCSLPGFSIYGILQTRILEWIVIFFSRRSSQPRDQTQVSCIASGFFTIWAATLLFFNIYLFDCAGSVMACRSSAFRCGMWTLSCSIRELVPWPGTEPRPPPLGAQSLSHWTTREVPGWLWFKHTHTQNNKY